MHFQGGITNLLNLHSSANMLHLEPELWSRHLATISTVYHHLVFHCHRRRLCPHTGSSLLTWPLCCVVSGWRRRMPLLLPPCRVLAPGTWVRSLRLVLPHPSPHLLPAGSLVCGLIWSQARVNLGSAQPQGSGSHPMKPGGSTAGVLNVNIITKKN